VLETTSGCGFRILICAQMVTAFVASCSNRLDPGGPGQMGERTGDKRAEDENYQHVKDMGPKSTVH
jgi:hypothetical protein